MLTVCSHCKTRFRISAEQLRAAQGQVRCGKCHEVFDAFEGMDGAVETKPLEPGLDSVSTPPQDLTAPLTATSEPAPELDVALAAVAEPPTEAPALKVGPRKGAPAPIDDLFAELMSTPAVEPEPLLPELGLHVDSVEPPLDFTIPITHEDLPLPPSQRPKRPWVSTLWWAGILLMLLLLGLQLVNANRVALAQNPVLGPSLTALYSALGRPVPPARSVSAWDVNGLNVTSDPQVPGVLSITGALQNQADFTQPWPYLRVELTDRFGQALRSRDFKPGDYLPGPQANTLLAAGQATRFRIDIADPGADAVGFTLAPCFDLPTGRVCSASEHE